MFNTKQKPMAEQECQVYKTFDYSLFKTIKGNRDRKIPHLKRLEKSITDKYLFTVIIVNEKHEIIDGQHRFEIIKKHGLPLYYIVCKGYGLNEVHVLNANSRTWNADDYMDGYIELGYGDYIIYKDFKSKYKLGHNESLMLLAGNCSSVGSNNYSKFANGEFKIKSLSKAEDIMTKILQYEKYYQGVRRRIFIFTMISLFNNKNFEHTEFLQKLKIQPTALQDCTSIESYKLLIEEIYNYRRREKVNLRFDNLKMSKAV